MEQMMRIPMIATKDSDDNGGNSYKGNYSNVNDKLIECLV